MIKKEPVRVVRCAIYTRKSSEEGLEQEFNSLDAQRESAESYIASLKHEGWVALPDRYDDGGYSGGTTDRPALKRLMAAIASGGVDCVLVYKIDRFSRSLLDFARLMETLEKHRTSFVAVTQQFNTATSMGRLMQNVLLSFAQFEREIISERTRDKIAASRRKGKWAGGRPILGYDLNPERTRLVVNPKEAERVREIFALYLTMKSLLEVSKELNRRGWHTKGGTSRTGFSWGGRSWDKSRVQTLMTNVAYIGRVRHHKETFAGEHEAIIDEALWDQVQATLCENGRAGGMHVRNKYGALLKGLLFCKPCGRMMGHSYTVKGRTRAYRYYTCYGAQKQGWASCPCKSLPAEAIEDFVVDRVRTLVRDPEMLALTLAKADDAVGGDRAELEAALRAALTDVASIHDQLRVVAEAAAADAGAMRQLADLHERLRIREAEAASIEANARRRTGPIERAVVDTLLLEFDEVWSALSSKERARILRLLILRVDYDAAPGTIAITFQPTGLRALAPAGAVEQEAAA